MNAATRSELAVLGDMPRSLTIPEDELIGTLRASLYAGASDNSIRLVVGYCRAQALDPMQKPVHIVPMSVKKPGTKDYEWRDVIMPGIGLYRTQAARTGEHVGTDEPVFGPMVDFTQGEFVMQVPEWCKVTVYRLKNGERCAYTATEYWHENYATAGRDSTLPNAMWKKRPRGQIAKCAEAQALRKGFPEIGSQPTAEEMEGKFLDEAGEIIAATSHKPAVAMPQAKGRPAPADVTDATPKGEQQPGAERHTGSGELATVGEIAYITKKITAKGWTIAQAREAAQLDAGDALDGLTKDGFVALKDAVA